MAISQPTYPTRTDDLVTYLGAYTDSKVAPVDRVVINAGNLGATYTLALAGQKNVILVGTVTANCVINVTGETAGCSYTMELTQDAVGGYTVTLPTAIQPTGALWPSPAPVALTTTVVDFFYDGTNRVATSTAVDRDAIVQARHIVSSTSSRNASAASAGIGSAVATASGQPLPTDTNGALDITIGGSPAANSVIAQVTFNLAYTAARPTVILTPRNLAAQQAGLFVGATFTGLFQIWVANAPTAAAVLGVNYVVLGAVA